MAEILRAVPNPLWTELTPRHIVNNFAKMRRKSGRRGAVENALIFVHLRTNRPLHRFDSKRHFGMLLQTFDKLHAHRCRRRENPALESRLNRILRQAKR